LADWEPRGDDIELNEVWILESDMSTENDTLWDV
jgi:hypothetical protein